MYRSNDKIFKKNLHSNLVISLVFELLGIIVVMMAFTGAITDLQMSFRNGDILGFILMFGGIALVVYSTVMMIHTMQFKQFFDATGMEEATVEEFQRWKATGKAA